MTTYSCKLPVEIDSFGVFALQYEFFEFRLDLVSQQLYGPAGVIPLRLKTLQLLLHMVKTAPAVNTRQELLDRVWGDVVVAESSLTQAISEIRKALGDTPQQARFIETACGNGYRFIAPITTTEAVVKTSSKSSQKHTNRTKHLVIGATSATLLLLLVVGLFQFQTTQNNHKPTRIATIYFENLDTIENDWLKAAIPSHFSRELERVSTLKVYTPHRLRQMYYDLGITGHINQNDIQAVHKYLDADYVVAGSYKNKKKDLLDVNLTVYNAISGETIYKLSENVNLLKLNKRANAWMRALLAKLDIPLPQRPVENTVLNIESIKNFFTAELISNKDPAMALKMLTDAAAEKPLNTRITATIAQLAWSQNLKKVATKFGRKARMHAEQYSYIDKNKHLLLFLPPDQAIAHLKKRPAENPGDLEIWFKVLKKLQHQQAHGKILFNINNLRNRIKQSWLLANFSFLEARAAKQLGKEQQYQRALHVTLTESNRRGQRTLLKNASLYKSRNQAQVSPES